MRPQVVAFRNTAAQACKLRNYSFARFLDHHGLEDILAQADKENWPAKKIAGRVLFECCLTDGRFNNFMVGFLTVVTYLNEQLGPLGKGEQQAFQDLVSILKNEGTQQAIDRWLDSHYA